MGSIHKRWKNLLEAVEAERSEEEAYFAKLNKNTSIKKKVENGTALYPINYDGAHYTVGDYVEVKLSVPPERMKPHKLKTGIGVRLFVNKGAETEYFPAVISFLRRNQISVILRSDHLTINDIPRNGLHGVEMIYDERPYLVMKEAVTNIIASTDNHISNLRLSIENINNSIVSPTYEPQIHYENPALNKSQIRAIQGVLASEDWAVIHGPPGTGKTTTISHLVKELAKTEKKVLVCAPSNNAVDLLAKRISHLGLSVLRVGNITRIEDDITHLTLEEKAKDDPDWQHIKKLKIQAEDARKKASTFKRKFGYDERAQRTSLYKEAKDLKKWAKDLEERLTEKIIDNAQVILTTLVSVSHRTLEDFRCRTLIIDEASQAAEPECWNAILRAQRVILVGDHLQLPPTIKSKKAQSLGLDTTLLDILTNRIYHSYLLNIQYRMNEQILKAPNAMFYKGKLLSHQSNARNSIANIPAVRFIDTAGTGFNEKNHKDNRSYYNEGEGFIINEFLLSKIEELQERSIGIISPYAEQVRYLTDQIMSEEAFKSLDIQINTIDGFQGQEKDVILLSLVRSNDKNVVGFLADERRLNVAITRAKLALIVIGDSGTLCNLDIFQKYLGIIESQESYGSAWEYLA